MADERDGVMNLDLNLGPVSPVSPGAAAAAVPGAGTGSNLGESVNLDDLFEESLQRRLREGLRIRQRWRWRDWRQAQLNRSSGSPHDNISMDLMLDSRLREDVAVAAAGVGGTLQTGEGSNAASDEAVKTCENNMGPPGDHTNVGEREDAEKGSGTDGGFFDCNICLDLSKEPVVTSCGHLFCWPCLYRWLHIHSDAKECPVCKGEVTVKNVTPIFGRGNNSREPEPDDEEEVDVKIPDRPPARRVESLRQAIQRTAFSIPMDEMIRHLGSRFDLTGELFHAQDNDVVRSAIDRETSLLNRILINHGRRREQTMASVPPPDDVVDLTMENDAPTSRAEGTEFNRRLPHLIYRRSSHSYRNSFSTSAAATAPSPATSSAERSYGGAVLRPSFSGRSQERLQDDRDSFSSIAAVIHGESQTMDTAVEIDSTVSHSTSSSRRRNDGSRISDVDSGDSRSPRRRRLN